MGSSEGYSLRQEALEALEKSTTMLEVALELIAQGNQAEAERLRGEGRRLRTISTLLMLEANSVERDRNYTMAPGHATANVNISKQVRRHSETHPLKYSA